MDRKIVMPVFILVFITLYSLLNYYVLNNISYLLEIEKNLIWYLVFALISFSFIFSMILERRFPSKITQAYYVISVSWMGLFLFLLSFLLINKIINLFVEIPNRFAGISIILLSMTLSAYSIINARIKIKKVEIPINNLKNPIKAVQLSDIHLGTVNKEKFLKRVVDQTNSLNPDVVFITGDLFDGSAPVEPHTLDYINKIKAPTYYVIGNHEIYDGLDYVMPKIKKTKLKVLRNKIVSWKDIQILGIDFSEDRKYLINTLDEMKITKLKSKKPIVLLCHAPTNTADELSKHNISLHLAGHTHNGQIFPFTLLVKLAYPYVKGLHQSKDKKTFVYVNPGTGTWGPPMRLGSRSEITLINLIPSK